MTVLHAPFYYVNLHQIQQPGARGKEHQPPYLTCQFEHYIRSLFFDNLVIIPKPLSTDGTFENSNEQM
jgi:hypothetical protein